MKIAIVGWGAMGTLFGALLARGGHEVWMVGRQPATAPALAHGLAVEGLAQFTARPAGATARPQEVPAVDLALVLVKAYHTRGAAETIAGFAAPPGAVLTLQNGAGNVEALAGRLGSPSILAGTTALGATYLGPGRVRQAGAGETLIGRPGGEPDPRCEQIAAAFRGAGIPTRVTDRVEDAIWRKLVVNCAVNAPAALARVPNGALWESAHLAQVVARAAAEAAQVGLAEGRDTPPAALVALARQVCAETAGNYNSMLQDVLAGRRTEIEAINGYVARRAAELGVLAPVNELLAALIAGIEQGYDKQVRGEQHADRG